MPNNMGLFRLLMWALFCMLGLICLDIRVANARATIDKPIVKLRSIDKVTAQTSTFEASVGEIVQFGSIFIKAQACRVAPDIEEPEAAAFLQIWEKNKDQALVEDSPSRWVFSGWMFASSPGLSAMDHPIYDVWVMGCEGEPAAPTNEDNSQAQELEAIDQGNQTQELEQAPGAVSE